MFVLSKFSLFQQMISARSDSAGMGGVKLFKSMHVHTHTHTLLPTHTEKEREREKESAIAYFNFSVCLHILS